MLMFLKWKQMSTDIELSKAFLFLVNFLTERKLYNFLKRYEEDNFVRKPLTKQEMVRLEKRQMI